MYKQKETTELLVASWEREDSTMLMDISLVLVKGVREEREGLDF